MRTTMIFIMPRVHVQSAAGDCSVALALILRVDELGTLISRISKKRRGNSP